MQTVETRLQDAVLIALENIAIHRKVSAMRSINASSGRGMDSVVLDPDQRDFSRNILSLQLTASSRKKSYTDLKIFDETRSNMTVEGVDLSVNEGNFDRQTHTHHNR